MREIDNPLWHSLVPIPHLELGLQFDVARLQQEYRAVSEDTWVSYKTRYPRVAKGLAEAWWGASLLSYNRSLHDDMEENLESMKAYPTGLAEQMPYAMDCLEKIGAWSSLTGEGIRTRVLIIKAGKGITWHSHILDGDKNEIPYAIVHIPIICPPEVRYSVISLMDFRFGDHEKTPLKVHTKHYAEGHAQAFNYVHYHNVFNDGDTDRVTLMAYVDLRQQKVKSLFERAIKNYNGPIID
jgi:hypothetical protein